MSQRNIRLISIIRFAQSFHLYIHAYALILLDRGLSLFQITAIESLVIATIFVMEIPTGIIADRIGRKGAIVAAIGFNISAEFLFLFAKTYPMYIMVAILTGTGFAFASGAIEAMVYDSLPLEDRDNQMKKTMGQINSLARLAFFISPIVGAFIIRDGAPENYTLAIALTVMALLVALLVSLFLQEPASEWDADKPHSMTILRDGIAELRGNPTLRRLTLLTIFTTPLTGMLIVTLAAPYLTLNGVSPFVIGMTLSIGSLFAVFTQRYAYKLETWLGQERAILFLLLLPALMYGVLALVSGSILPVVVIIIMYATNEMKSPLFSAYQNGLIGSKNRATVLSIINMLLNLFVAIVSPLYAAIGMFSLPLAFLIIGCVIVLAVIVLGVPKLEG
ncbi:MAG: MFS transporter [Phototrophicaceae bacterium]